MQRKNVRWPLSILLLFFIILSCAPLLLAAEKQTASDRVAVVNGVIFTQEDLDTEMLIIKKRLSMMKRPLNDSQLQDFKEKTLEKIIGRELLLQESQKKKIMIDDAKVNEEFMALKKRYESEDDFKKSLSANKLTEAGLKDRLKKSMAIKKLVDQLFTQKVNITETEIKSYYEKQPQLFKKPEMIHASHILIKVDPKADEAKKSEARTKIEEIQQRLKKGEDFSALAKELSQCPSNAKGGSLNYFSRGQMVKPFEEAAFSLKPGGISDVVETRFGYHLIKVVDKKAETTITFKDAKDRIEKHLKNTKVQDQVKKYVDTLKNNAKIEVFQN
ncbi:MAG: peptidylprolyl isomerase [Thermodesulfobacteriota bacterium]|nr:peptidylprolyl isomerase [Thermodesulfobacteriota bacterium]